MSTIAWCLLLVEGLSAATASDERHAYVCNNQKAETEAFEQFKKGAGGFDPNYTPPANIDSVSYTTSDGKTMAGYMAKARGSTHFLAEPLGYILLLPGNAVYAQDLISEIRELSLLGYDVYVYDYRGYGRSAGPSTVAGIISDAKELIIRLNRSATEGGRGYATHVIYGISAGGAIALNALDANSKIDRLILDGLPATMSVKLRLYFEYLRVPILECPAELAPMNRAMFDSKRSLLIKGNQDVVLANTQYKRDQDRLLAKAKAAGVCVSVQPKFGHPLMDGLTSPRIQLIEKFLKADLTQGCPSFPIY